MVYIREIFLRNFALLENDFYGKKKNKEDYLFIID